MKYTTILFDIDGTLCDPGSGIIDTAQYTLSKLGIDEKDPRALQRFVGPPLEHVFRDLYGFDDTTVANASHIFREKFRKDSIELYQAYKGIPELLSELSENGATLAIVTSKMDDIAKKALQNSELMRYFKVIGSQHMGAPVKKEIILSKVLFELNPDTTSSIVMIGDRMHDIEAAKAHSIDSIGVLWGYGSKDELATEGATHIVHDTSELERLLLDDR